jgi:hypothetical protein
MRNLIMACLLVAAGTQAAYAKPNNFDVLVRNTGIDVVDLGQTGPSIGDIAVTRGDVYSRKTNQLIGTYVSRKILVSVDIPGGLDERDTISEYTLKDGSITIVGITTNNSGTNLVGRKDSRPIVGGTVKYAGAKGVSTITPVDGQPRTFLVEMRFK